MRLLPQDEQDKILSAACTFLKTSYNFFLPTCSDSVRIISGEEEGLFGWLAVNFLMDGFDRHAKNSQRLASTYGFLDMGGASTQIAFEPSPDEQIRHADNLVSVQLRDMNGNDVIHPVFVTTWLGYGTNRARERYVDAAIEAFAITQPVNDQDLDPNRQPPMHTISDPCLPKALSAIDKRHPNFTFHGTGDFAQCVLQTNPLLNKNTPCLDEPCLFNGIHVPSIDFSVNHFIGVSEYWYSTQEVWNLGGVYDFVTFEKSAVDYCAREWPDIVNDHASGTHWGPRLELNRLELQCFKASWLINILHEGIGIPRLTDIGGSGDDVDQGVEAQRKAGEKGFAKAPPNFQSVNEINNIEISWTLGKMILEVSKSVPSAKMSNWTEPTYGHYSAWDHTLGSSAVRAFAHIDPFVYLFIFLLLMSLWLCKFGGSSFRRRMINLFAKPRQDDYSLIGLEEGISLRSHSSMTISVATSNSRLSGSVQHPSALFSQFSTFLRGCFRSGYRPSAFVYENSNEHFNNRPNDISSRPKPLRHAYSSPNMLTQPFKTEMNRQVNRRGDTPPPAWPTRSFTGTPLNRWSAHSSHGRLASDGDMHVGVDSIVLKNDMALEDDLLSASASSIRPGSSLSRASSHVSLTNISNITVEGLRGRRDGSNGSNSNLGTHIV